MRSSKDHADKELLRDAYHDRPTVAELTGQSPQIEKVRQQIRRMSQYSGAPVLIIGETGTGKEVVAELLHASSPRADKPFIALNCGAIPELLFESQFFGHRKGAFTGANDNQKGFVEAAQDGTLFLDEIGTLALALQPKLLRFLENGSYTRVGEAAERKADVRVMAASNENFEELIAQKRFRPDLYYRLKGVEIHLPPLRERPEDILFLAREFLKQFSALYALPTKSLSGGAEKVLLRHHWPGNVRELKQLMMNLTAMVDDDIILPQHLPEEFVNPENAIAHEKENLVTLRDVERAHIARTLERTGFNLKQTAKQLGISRNALKRKIATYKIVGVRNGPT